MSGRTVAIAYESIRYLRRWGEPNVACHIAALPASFVNPGTSLAVIPRNRTSGDQAIAARFIGQKAVLADTSCGGAADCLAAPGASPAGVDCEQPAQNSTATAIALTAHGLNTDLIGV